MKTRFARITALAVLAALAALPVAAQDTTTPTPEPLPNCPEFQGQAKDVRTGYYMGEGIAYLKANQLDQSEFSFTCVIRIIDPNDAQAYLGRASVYESLNDYDHALDDYNNALQINPNSIVARNNRGIVLTIQGDYKTAAADFDRVLQINANYLPAVNNRSIVYSLQGDYDSAVNLIDQGIKRSGADVALQKAHDPQRTPNSPPLVVDPTGMQLYALRGILEAARSLGSFQNYSDLADASNNFADQRISDVAGSLQSRLTFDLRLDNGSWMIHSDFTSET